jgi:hypothetical protein
MSEIGRIRNSQNPQLFQTTGFNKGEPYAPKPPSLQTQEEPPQPHNMKEMVTLSGQAQSSTSDDKTVTDEKDEKQPQNALDALTEEKDEVSAGQDEKQKTDPQKATQSTLDMFERHKTDPKNSAQSTFDTFILQDGDYTIGADLLADEPQAEQKVQRPDQAITSSLSPDKAAEYNKKSDHLVNSLGIHIDNNSELGRVFNELPEDEQAGIKEMFNNNLTEAQLKAETGEVMDPFITTANDITNNEYFQNNTELVETADKYTVSRQQANDAKDNLSFFVMENEESIGKGLEAKQNDVAKSDLKFMDQYNKLSGEEKDLADTLKNEKLQDAREELFDSTCTHLRQAGLPEEDSKTIAEQMVNEEAETRFRGAVSKNMAFASNRELTGAASESYKHRQEFDAMFEVANAGGKSEVFEKAAMEGRENVGKPETWFENSVQTVSDLQPQAEGTRKNDSIMQTIMSPGEFQEYNGLADNLHNSWSVHNESEEELGSAFKNLDAGKQQAVLGIFNQENDPALRETKAMSGELHDPLQVTAQRIAGDETFADNPELQSAAGKFAVTKGQVNDNVIRMEDFMVNNMDKQKVNKACHHLDNKLDEAGEAMGQQIAALSPEEKEHIGMLENNAREVAQETGADGNILFIDSIKKDPHLSQNDKLISSADNYCEKSGEYDNFVDLVKDRGASRDFMNHTRTDGSEVNPEDCFSLHMTGNPLENQAGMPDPSVGSMPPNADPAQTPQSPYDPMKFDGVMQKVLDPVEHQNYSALSTNLTTGSIKFNDANMALGETIYGLSDQEKTQVGQIFDNERSNAFQAKMQGQQYDTDKMIAQGMKHDPMLQQNPNLMHSVNNYLTSRDQLDAARFEMGGYIGEKGPQLHQSLPMVQAEKEQAGQALAETVEGFDRNEMRTLQGIGQQATELAMQTGSSQEQCYAELLVNNQELMQKPDFAQAAAGYRESVYNETSLTNILSFGPDSPVYLRDFNSVGKPVDMDMTLMGAASNMFMGHDLSKMWQNPAQQQQQPMQTPEQQFYGQGQNQGQANQMPPMANPTSGQMIQQPGMKQFPYGMTTVPQNGAAGAGGSFGQFNMPGDMSKSDMPSAPKPYSMGKGETASDIVGEVIDGKLESGSLKDKAKDFWDTHFSNFSNSFWK